MNDGGQCVFLFFGSILWCSWSRCHKWEDLARFSFKGNRKVQKFKYSFYTVGYLLESNVDIWQFLMKCHYEKPQKSLKFFHISYFQICLYSGLMELRFLETQNHYFLSTNVFGIKNCDVNLTNLSTFRKKLPIFCITIFLIKSLLTTYWCIARKFSSFILLTICYIQFLFVNIWVTKKVGQQKIWDMYICLDVRLKNPSP